MGPEATELLGALATLYGLGGALSVLLQACRMHLRGTSGDIPVRLGRKWVEEVMGLSVEVARKPEKPVPEKVAEVSGPGSGPGRARRSAGRGSCRRGVCGCWRVGRWVVERTFAWR